ncbi:MULTISPECIES: tyrosine-type recombinase/integrase [Providencia]|uniref:tyrosine-type recombinase/integrase n=2 Tax=Morganellaceae TaxID=1903414 RepID=UPI001ADD51F4|nr:MULTISPECIES: tyrosine-type recombinase/integrase [Providencia]MBO8254467.1 tyrosine-type recombinase/integrase [Providencia rettgeri]MBO8258667.1 tyrosine-type recombinase/integrase [Providencia rettgeri]
MAHVHFMYISCNSRGYYIWQKSYVGKLIRFDLRTRDLQIAHKRSKILLSTFHRLKKECIDFDEIRGHLMNERDMFIEEEIHLEANYIYWINSGNLPNRQQNDSRFQAKGHKISQIADEWYTEMKSEWRPLTFKSNKAAVDYLISLYGDTDIESFDKSKVASFKNSLKNKYNSEFSSQSMFKKVSALFSFAAGKRDYISKNPFSGMGYKKIKKVNPKISVSCESHKKALELIEHKSHFWWLLQVLYYTGMRVTECIQLTELDYIYIIDKEKKIACISVNDKNSKRIKNSSSIRNIPIHKDLLQNGIMDVKPVFPWKVHNSVSNAVANLFKKINEKHSPHDYRYAMSDRLRDISDLPDHVRFNILGHSSKTITDRIYRGKEPILLMKEAIDRT